MSFAELERKPLTELEEMLVQSFDHYLRRKGYLTKRQVEVLQGIARKHDVPLHPIPLSPHQTESSQTKQETTPQSVPFQETKSPIELGEAMLVKPEVLAKWREWKVPEEIVARNLIQRKLIRQIRRVEEKVTLSNFAYKMPRLPKIETEAWGFAKAIDAEGHIDVRLGYYRNKLAKEDRWRYRYEYSAPRIEFRTTSYPFTEEIANMMHSVVTIKHDYNPAIRDYSLYYETRAHTARAVRIAYLIQPHLTVAEKEAQATQILNTYRTRPMTRR